MTDSEVIIAVIAIITITITGLAAAVTIDGLHHAKNGYEFETIDGHTGTAERCWTPSRGTPRCALDDGTMVFGLKSYKEVPAKGQEGKK